ncbi:4-(cytidine 5'-diphospho)-2-C-methyl-D-erythritol kinase [Trueperella sp. LYQ141]|uniref:4-(cytidine 5'-diphospho)-2-C-methyl-D-erythritol kinase n=1 Tax=Trueperella sp. LYQ141 TaxID=3391058 RepID=UPI0039838C18
MKRIQVCVPAKINLALRVGAPRPDGFHPLDTVFESLDIFDDIEATLAPDLSMSITGLGSDLPCDERNLVMRAAILLRERYASRAADQGSSYGAHIQVTKRIPVAGGMAGGSADAAGTLLALNELWQLQLSSRELADIAGELGSDVPFALHGGLAHGTGRGELLHAIPPGHMHSWVIVLAHEGLSTPQVFREFDRLYPQAAAPASTQELRQALSGTDLRAVAALLRNDLAPAAFSLRPELEQMCQSLSDIGHGVIVSGSGPTIAVLVEPHELTDAVKIARMRFPEHTILGATGPAAGAHVR